MATSVDGVVPDTNCSRLAFALLLHGQLEGAMMPAVEMNRMMKEYSG